MIDDVVKIKGNMLQICLANAVLVSVDERVIPIYKKGKPHIILSRAYRKCIDALTKQIRAMLPDDFEIFTQNIVVHLEISTRKDLDNVLKPIIDAMQHAKIIKNDSRVVQINARKKAIQNNGESVFITVYEIEGNQ